MTALPPGQSAILGGGFSPWQAPLSALFSGLAAAGQPGGWANFGPGVIQGSQNFQNQQMQMIGAQRDQQLFDMQREQHDGQMRRANQEEAQRKARIDAVTNLLRGPQPVAATLGGQTASAPAEQPQAALFSQYAGIPPHARQSAILSGGYP